MNEPATTPAPSSYLNGSRLPFAFCPGCGHTRVVEQLAVALAQLQIDRQRIVIVTDIGCSGIADQYFRTHAFHGLHGRSVTYASGIKLACPELTVIVLMGDGGCGIGGHHLISAARRNAGIAVLVLNNFNYGMTGGQVSVTTPLGARTATTPLGNLEQPLDIAATVACNGAAFVARKTVFDEDLAETLAEAIACRGFSLVDIWELCTAHFVPANQFGRRALESTMADLGLGQGTLQRAERPEWEQALRAAGEQVRGQPVLPLRPLTAQFGSGLSEPWRMVLAGAAGQRVRTAAHLLASAGTLCGLWAAARDDYPITVRTGYSMAEIILSPEPIEYHGVDEPDGVVVTAVEGAARIRGLLARLGQDVPVFADESLAPGLVTSGRLVPLALPEAASSHRRKSLATLAVGQVAISLDLVPLEALLAAARQTQRPEVAADSVAALEALRSA